MKRLKIINQEQNMVQTKIYYTLLNTVHVLMVRHNKVNSLDFSCMGYMQIRYGHQGDTQPIILLNIKTKPASSLMIENEDCLLKVRHLIINSSNPILYLHFHHAKLACIPQRQARSCPCNKIDQVLGDEQHYHK